MTAARMKFKKIKKTTSSSMELPIEFLSWLAVVVYDYWLSPIPQFELDYKMKNWVVTCR